MICLLTKRNDTIKRNDTQNHIFFLYLMLSDKNSTTTFTMAILHPDPEKTYAKKKKQS